MSIESDLKKEGIEVQTKLDTLKVNSIAKTIAELLVKAFPEHNFKTDELFKRLARLNMYTAKVPNGLSEANYFYKNTSIYYNEKIDLNDIYKYALHECIHYLQERKSSRGKLIRLGLCDMAGVKVYGLGINEAATQYTTAKALHFKNDTVKYYGITFDTISPNFYPLECNMIAQMAYITEEYSLLDSTFNSNNNFKNKFIEATSKDTYEIVESNFDKILFAEEDLIKLNNKLALEEHNDAPIQAKITKQKHIIKNTFFETQNLIIESYFNNYFNSIKTVEEVDKFRRKLYNYKNLIGITEDYFFFNNYYIKMMEKLEDKKAAIENGIEYVFNTHTDMVSSKQNKIALFFKAIKEFLFGNANEYQKI